MVTCPYCGSEVDRQPGENVLTCPYCGTAFTLSGRERVSPKDRAGRDSILASA